jgi:hypothetical protein
MFVQKDLNGGSAQPVADGSIGHVVRRLVVRMDQVVAGGFRRFSVQIVHVAGEHRLLDLKPGTDVMII